MLGQPQTQCRPIPSNSILTVYTQITLYNATMLYKSGSSGKEDSSQEIKVTYRNKVETWKSKATESADRVQMIIYWLMACGNRF